MKLKPEEEKILRRYISSVEGIVARFVPSPVPGISAYNQMMTYLDLEIKLKTLLDPPKKRSKWRQIDLEEQIKQEKENK